MYFMTKYRMIAQSSHLGMMYYDLQNYLLFSSTVYKYYIRIENSPQKMLQCCSDNLNANCFLRLENSLQKML